MTDHAGAALELRAVGKSFGLGQDQRVRAADDVSWTSPPARLSR
jgi:hypothetical protein